MIRVQTACILLAVGALVIAVAALQGHHGMASHPRTGGIAVSAVDVRGAAAGTPAARDRVTRAAQATAPTRVAPARVLRVAPARPGQGLHMTFPRTWRAVTLEVKSTPERAPLRVFCLTCPPGTVPQADL